MQAVILNLIEKHGITLSVKNGAFSWRAFVEPLRYKNKMYVEETSVAEGMINRTAYRYIGPANVDLHTVAPRGTLISFGNELVTVSHCETVSFDGKPLYVYGVLNYYSEQK